MQPATPTSDPTSKPSAADFASRQLGPLITCAWALFIVGALALAVDQMVTPPGTDSSTFIYVAEGLLSGELPYLDRWDHKGPLIYLLNVAGLALAGLPGILLMNAAFLIGSAWLAFRVAADAFGKVAALPALVLFLVYFALFCQGGNLSESYALTFQLLALFLFARLRIEHRMEPSGTWSALTIGILGAMAFILRPNLIGIWIAIGIVWALQRGAGLKLIAWSCVGGVLTLSVIAAALIASGSWDAMWEAYIVYNFAYVDSPLTDRIRALATLAYRLNILAPLLAMGWLICLRWLAAGKTRRLPFNNVMSLAIFLAPIEVALIVMSGFAWTHYYLAILPVAVVLTAFLAWLLMRQLETSPQIVSSAILAALTLTALFAVNAPVRVYGMAEKYLNSSELLNSDHRDQIASRIREQSDPDDSVLVWGTASWIYSLSERDASTRFFYQYPLVKPGYANSVNRGEFMADVIRHRPAIIVDTGNRRLAPLDPVERGSWQPTDSRYIHDPSDFQPFFSFVEAEYEHFGEVSGYTLFRLKQ